MNDIKFSNRLTPINNQSDEILKRKEFALIGVSPFNSYFSVEQIFSMLELVSQNFDDFAIFIPDKISRFTLKAMGYSDSRTHHKIRKQDNYLKNKVTKALDQLNQFSATKNNNIVTLSAIEDTPQYINLYNSCIDLFRNDVKFRNGCINTSSWVLSSYEKTKGFIIDDSAKETAVEYFLRELPIFLSAPEILNVNSCVFIYNGIPDFLREIYNSYNLISKSQGFVVFETIAVPFDDSAINQA
jgi:cyclo(L-tyrosyl-L-tyrosyl) synthase